MSEEIKPPETVHEPHEGCPWHIALGKHGSRIGIVITNVSGRELYLDNVTTDGTCPTWRESEPPCETCGVGGCTGHPWWTAFH